ncbi:MAG: hypothetical protein SFT81_02545 [Candidatus Caenarcaniphilales bacterium]|nr:hypothetical protein [Candidatus Caenarcaniphilales bacterium]
MFTDPWSIVLSIVLSTFGFLLFILWNRKHEINTIEKRVFPAAKESQDVLIKNFLSLGDIPTKSKLISIMTSVARKHQVQLLVHLPIPNVIDNLVYYVISNDLLDPSKKKEITDNLIRLKTEPMNSEDYYQMVAESEESQSWKQKITYAQLIRVLVASSVGIIALGLGVNYFADYIAQSPQAYHTLMLTLTTMIGFSILIAGYTVMTIFTNFSKPSLSAPTDQGQTIARSAVPMPSYASASSSLSPLRAHTSDQSFLPANEKPEITSNKPNDKISVASLQTMPSNSSTRRSRAGKNGSTAEEERSIPADTNTAELEKATTATASGFEAI